MEAQRAVWSLGVRRAPLLGVLIKPKLLLPHDSVLIQFYPNYTRCEPRQRCARDVMWETRLLKIFILKDITCDINVSTD